MNPTPEVRTPTTSSDPATFPDPAGPWVAPPTSPDPTTSPEPTARSHTHGRVLLNELREELLGVFREPTTLFFSVAMPVGFFAIFIGMWGGETNDGTSAATSMLATFGTFGVVGVSLLTPGISVAEDRNLGWLRVKRVSATPLLTTISAKMLACVPHALGVFLAMTVLALASGHAQLDPATWARLAVVLLIGSLPFALLGLAVGFLASTNATNAILMAIYLPSAVASGLWMPLEMLPDVVERIAPALPTYHLAQLALAQIEGGGGLANAGALLAFTIVAAVAATFVYRRSRP